MSLLLLTSNQSFSFVMKPKVSIDTLEQIGKACAEHNFKNVFKFLKRMESFDGVFDNELLYLTIQKSDAAFVEMMINHFEEDGMVDSYVEMEALHEAVCKGDFSIVEYLVNKRNLRNAVKKLQTVSNILLHECVIDSRFGTPTEIKQRTQVIGFLVSINRDMLEFKDDEGRTPLLASNVPVDLLIKLIQLGANTCAQDRNKNNVLHTSHYLTQEDYHRLILFIGDAQLKKIISLKGPKTGTRLLKPFVSVDIEAVTTYSFGAQLATANWYGDAILANIISLGKSKFTVQKLVECGADINWKGKNSETLLHVAAHWGRLDAVKFLLEDYGFDVNALDKNGLTPMDYVLQSINNYGDRYSTGVELNKLGGIFKEVINSKGHSWLHVAAANENLDSINLLLNFKMDVNRIDEEGNAPLHFVMDFRNHKFNYFYVTKLLLNSNADPNIRNKNGDTPFYMAIRNKHLNFATFALLKSVTDIEWTPLLASQTLDFVITTSQYISDDELYDLLMELEAHGANVGYKNAEDEDKNSLLHIAVKSNHLRAIQFLVENKDEHVDLRNARQQTPLIAAAIHTGNWEIMKYLIDRGADVYATEEKSCNFLHFYIEKYPSSPLQFHSLAEYLVEKGYSNLIDTPAEKHGTTPLQAALYRLNLEEKTLALLHSYNANFHYLNKYGHNILVFAVLGKQSPKVLEALTIHYGVNPRQLTPDKNNLLHLAALFGTEELLQFCLDLDIFSVDEKNKQGETPLHLALYWDDDQVDVLEKCKLLTENEANVNLANLLQRTPIHVAASNKDNFISLEAIGYLVENGGDMLAADANNCNFLHFFFGNSRKISPSEFHNLVEYIVSKGGCHLFNNLSTVERHGTPLQLAIRLLEPFKTTLALLQSHGVDFNIFDGLGRSLLVHAVMGGRSTDFVTYLINQVGLDWKQLWEKKSNLLHYSAYGGNVDSLEFILGLEELSVNQVTDEGHTPLHFAVKTNKPEYALEMCQLLIDNGADASMTDNQGKTPLDIVLERFAEGDYRDELMEVLRTK